MTRGIHLKQLTKAHLELLGLPEGSEPPVPGDCGIGAGGSTVPPEQGQLPAAAEVLRGGDDPHPPRVGPPANPATLPGCAGESEHAPDWQPLDLGSLARELRSELEATLRLLDGSPDQKPLPDQATRRAPD